MKCEIPNTLVLVNPDPKKLDQEICRSDATQILILGDAEIPMERALNILSLLNQRNPADSVTAAYVVRPTPVLALKRKAFDALSGFPEEAESASQAMDEFWNRIVADHTLSAMRIEQVK